MTAASGRRTVKPRLNRKRYGALLADMLPFINRFPERPLIWNVCWKSVLYFAVASVIHYLERLYDFWKEAPGFAAANAKLLP